jgi:hypothetical protein
MCESTAQQLKKNILTFVVCNVSLISFLKFPPIDGKAAIIMHNFHKKLFIKCRNVMQSHTF